MRILFAAPLLLLLCACGTNPEIGTPFVNSITAFANGLTAQDTLEVDLRKDFARKSLQLRFISLDTYSCGDPDDEYIEILERDYRTINKRYVRTSYDVLLKARKEARTKDAMLAALVEYGKIISDLTKTYKEAGTTINNAQIVVDTFKKSAIFAEATLILSALEQVIKIAKTAHEYTAEAAIRAAAFKMKGPLRATVKSLKDSKILLGLSANEALAFSYWDACARERLRFIREYYPLDPCERRKA